MHLQSGAKLVLAASVAGRVATTIASSVFGPHHASQFQLEGGHEQKSFAQSLPTFALLPATVWAGSPQEKPGSAGSAAAVYELRVYHVYEGKLDDLLKRFRDHTTRLFEKHGIKNLAYWTPLDDPLKGKTLFYIVAHPSRDAATSNWKAFGDDPEWQKVRDQSETNGKLVEKIESTFLALTDFSPVP